jgi:hypothetical protein
VSHHPAPVSKLPDVSRLVADVSRTFNPLSRDFDLDIHARHLNGDLVQISFILPRGMTRAFVALLESMTGLVRFADNKARYAAAEIKAIDPHEIEQRRLMQQNYRDEVCALFDGFIAAGSDRQDAIKRTSRSLKAKKHPWATHDLVQETLRKEGRLKSSQPKKVSAPRKAR